MSKVYVLTEYDDCETNDIIGVFTTHELATKKAIERRSLSLEKSLNYCNNWESETKDKFISIFKGICSEEEIKEKVKQAIAFNQKSIKQCQEELLSIKSISSLEQLNELTTGSNYCIYEFDLNT